jgi:hypothetical protein
MFNEHGKPAFLRENCPKLICRSLSRFRLFSTGDVPPFAIVGGQISFHSFCTARTEGRGTFQSHATLSQNPFSTTLRKMPSLMGAN